MKAMVIFGLGAEGMSTYHYLYRQNRRQDFLLVDDKQLGELSPQWQEVLANNENTRFLQAKEVRKQHLVDSIIVKTPGISPAHPVLLLSKKSKIQITSNTQLFFEYLNQHAPEAKTIGVTGTKGKSTTTALIHHVLSSNNLPALLAGNIGEPALNLVADIKRLQAAQTQPIIVLEFSSHQLMNLAYSPNIAVVLDITPEHLDYYVSFAQYAAAKSAICRFQQPEDLVIFDPILQGASQLAKQSQAQQLLFADTTTKTSPTALEAELNHNVILLHGKKILSATMLPLTGRHQWLNALPSVIIGKQFGLSDKQIAKALTSYQPLPHRLEFITEKKGTRYYNDSQATTPEAAIAALRSFPDNTVVLIAGGSDKGADLSAFAQEIIERGVTAVALFPPTGQKIQKLVEATTKKNQQTPPAMRIVDSMPKALAFALKHTSKNSVILLSPACASFGIFKNYQDRGEQFRNTIDSLVAYGKN